MTAGQCREELAELHHDQRNKDQAERDQIVFPGKHGNTEGNTDGRKENQEHQDKRGQCRQIQFGIGKDTDALSP